LKKGDIIMRDHRKLDAFHSLDYLWGELYLALSRMNDEAVRVLGHSMLRTLNEAMGALIHGCSTRNALTFLPYVERAHGYNGELGHYLRQCKRMKFLDDADCEFLIQRQSSCADQLHRLLRRQLILAESYARPKTGPVGEEGGSEND
jgi:hypothetical protein